MSYITALIDNGITHTVILLFALLFAVQEILKLADWTAGRFGIETKWSLKEKSQAQMLIEHDKMLTSISAGLQKTNEEINCLTSRMKELRELIEKNDHENRLFHLDIQRKNDANKRAELKDRIGQSYRYYHTLKEWNRMEKEAFYDLVKDYELHGGENSFVHEKCVPESYTWELTD